MYVIYCSLSFARASYETNITRCRRYRRHCADVSFGWTRPPAHRSASHCRTPGSIDRQREPGSDENWCRVHVLSDHTLPNDNWDIYTLPPPPPQKKKKSSTMLNFSVILLKIQKKSQSICWMWIIFSTMMVGNWFIFYLFFFLRPI